MSTRETYPDEMSPSRYIEKVSLVSGEALDDEVEAHQLLVHSHRDYHMADFQARRFMARVVSQTGDEEGARQRMRDVRRRGHRAAEVIAKSLGHKHPDRVSEALFGLKDREYYFRFKRSDYSREEIDTSLIRLRREAAEQYAAITTEGRPAIKVLVTGGTGFVGKEILWQAAHDDDIAEVVVLIRPKEIRDRKTKELIRTLSPAERGEMVLRQIWLDGPLRAKFSFVGGDIEQPNLGIDETELKWLARRLTHVVHCAASVSFDDPYEASFIANVQGTVNALRFSLGLQEAAESPFVKHIGIETSYIHGRQVKQSAREDEIVFPRNFYNNYYELTKALGSIETERFMLDKGLRVVQLCPAIVIGESRTGNNRGDTKVLNAPVNIFGRTQQAIDGLKGNFAERSKAAMLAKMAATFPADPAAQINLIPVDWVVKGIMHSLKRPACVGIRVHLATDNRMSAGSIRQIVKEEIGLQIKLAEPTMHRNISLPLQTKVLNRLNQPKLAKGLEKLGTIFGGYGEWGQPVHAVGNDVRCLDMPEQRPNTEHAFRLLCRHNRFVQNFGQIWDLDEMSRREKVWLEFIEEVEIEWGGPAGSIPAADFQRLVARKLDLDGFTRREPATH